MSDPQPTSTRAPRLRVSPAFNLSFAMDGRPYVAKDTEPYVQYWLTDRDRLLHTMFAGRRGATVVQAIEGYCRLTRAVATTAERARLQRSIADMRDAGVLVSSRDDVSRYGARIVDDYVTHRPFPVALADAVVTAAPVAAATRVLDLAGGPGDLALALARVSKHVSLMDLSSGFLAAACRRAAVQGVPLTTIHDSCNRLVHRHEAFDVVTLSQALHWLDDVLVVRGVCRVLRPSGSFFLIHASIDVPDEHPLASVLGRHSVFGHKTPLSFDAEVRVLGERLARLFDALDAPGEEHIEPVKVSLFRQRRPFELGYVRGFLTDAHIRGIGREPSEFWHDLSRRAADPTTSDVMGIQHWALIHFARGGAGRVTTNGRARVGGRVPAAAPAVAIDATGAPLAQGPRLAVRSVRASRR